mmetsp:Transcript_69932/g.146197  ORF Transcript_69932/g.146197 Transcript_69932/m.146197 type:complete len:240 (+) Transcript_69932:831-1550(+)
MLQEPDEAMLWLHCARDLLFGLAEVVHGRQGSLNTLLGAPELQRLCLPVPLVVVHTRVLRLLTNLTVSQLFEATFDCVFRCVHLFGGIRQIPFCFHVAFAVLHQALLNLFECGVLEAVPTSKLKRSLLPIELHLHRPLVRTFFSEISQGRLQEPGQLLRPCFFNVVGFPNLDLADAVSQEIFGFLHLFATALQLDGGSFGVKHGCRREELLHPLPRTNAECLFHFGFELCFALVCSRSC